MDFHRGTYKSAFKFVVGYVFVCALNLLNDIVVAFNYFILLNAVIMCEEILLFNFQNPFRSKLHICRTIVFKDDIR